MPALSPVQSPLRSLNFCKRSAIRLSFSNSRAAQKSPRKRLFNLPRTGTAVISGYGNCGPGVNRNRTLDGTLASRSANSVRLKLQSDTGYNCPIMKTRVPRPKGVAVIGGQITRCLKYVPDPPQGPQYSIGAARAHEASPRNLMLGASHSVRVRRRLERKKWISLRLNSPSATSPTRVRTITAAILTTIPSPCQDQK